MDEKEKDEEKITFSRCYKIRMNRVFREYGGIKGIPYPEVDNLFEKYGVKSQRFICAEKAKGISKTMQVICRILIFLTSML